MIWRTAASTHSIGYLLPRVVDALARVPVRIKGELEVNQAARTVLAFPFPTEEERSKAVDATLRYWREKGTFKDLAGWRDELYPVYEADGETVLWRIERAGSHLFGSSAQGIHPVEGRL